MSAARLVLVASAIAASAARTAHAEPPPGSAPAAPAPPPAEPAPEPPPPGTTTEVWREPTPPLDLGRHALRLPEYAVELALTPLEFTVGLVQRYRIDKRVYDLLRNDAGTIKVVPSAKFSGGDGFGAGASLELDNVFEREEELSIGGLVLLNSDYETSLRYQQRVATLEGRLVAAEVHYELDQNLKYYGLGDDTEKSDERVIGERQLDVEAAMDLLQSEVFNGGGLVRVGYRSTRLGPGDETGVMPLGEPGDTVQPTADFDNSYHDYARAALSLYRDTRDRAGRTTRGTLTELDLGATIGLEQADLGAASARARFTWFVPILPIYRVLVLSAGAAAVGRLTPGDSVPLMDMVLLDRKRGLRGYSTGRFRDQLGYWASAEYRYPIWDYQDTGVAMSPALFLDTGRVGGSLAELSDGPPRWSAGGGLRIEHDTRLIMVIEIGWSTEGYEVGFNLGKEF